MGLYPFEIETIVKTCFRLKPPFKVLSLGHPDILGTPDQLRKIVNADLPVHGKEIRQGRYPAVVGRADVVFKALGGSLTVYDIRPGYGVDHIGDLNSPNFDAEGEYDLVIDPGTSEHCFNVGTAIMNMAKSVKLGGYIYHMVPMCHWNHGFWNFSPAAFSDFYEANGFYVLTLRAEFRGRFMPVETLKKFEIETRGRKLNLQCIARRDRRQDLTWPMQKKYVIGCA